MNLAGRILKCKHWQFVLNCELPDKCVICVAPHTSNWDFILGELCIRSIGKKASFLMKKTWFFFPLGPIMRALGGIPVDCGKSTHVTQSVVSEFNNRRQLMVAVTPEGTRSPNPNWHKGFLHMATQAQVPVVLAYFNYAQHIVCIDRQLNLTGDADAEVELNVKSTYIGKKIFTAHHISKRFGDKVILKDLNYTFARYEKLGIVGDNGVGKSTFIKLLLGELDPDEGHFEIGETVHFGYYSQDGIEFDESQKVIDAARDIAEYVYFDQKTHYTASQFLNLFLFSTKDQQKFIAKLSGGEKRRLYLATVLMRKPNFLILDEPTNDLDISTLEILEDYLAHFKGCVIIVSHDRFFMDRTVDHTFVFQGNGVVKDFPGNYSEYRAWKDYHDQLAAQQSKVTDKHKDKQQYNVRDNSNKLTYKEKKELEQLSADIEALNAEKLQLDAIFASGETIDDVETRAARYEDVKALLDEKELRWLELSEKEG